jgi:hypothetical protein
MYSAAFYWSVTTLTSVGFSDGEFKPVNSIERLLAAACMLCSGAIWLHAIGLMAAIATTLDPNAILFQNTMDALNHFMRERRLPRVMRMTLRDYFAAARDVHQLNDDATLLSKMSPLLQGTVALAANQRWIDKIWYFHGMVKIAGEGGREVPCARSTPRQLFGFGHDLSSAALGCVDSWWLDEAACGCVGCC